MGQKYWPTGRKKQDQLTPPSRDRCTKTRIARYLLPVWVSRNCRRFSRLAPKTGWKRKDGKQTWQEIGYELLENYWDSSPYSSDFKENQDKIKAKKMIDNFLNWTDSNSHNVIGVEIPFQFSIQGIPIRGKIDKLAQCSTHIHIWNINIYIYTYILIYRYRY